MVKVFFFFFFFFFFFVVVVVVVVLIYCSTPKTGYPSRIRNITFYSFYIYFLAKFYCTRFR